MVPNKPEARFPSGTFNTVQGEGFGDRREIISVRQREHCCAGGSIGRVVMHLPRMIDIFLSATACDGALQAHYLRHEALVARQRDASAVEEREQVRIELALRFLYRLILESTFCK